MEKDKTMMNAKEMAEQIAKLQAENEALRTKANSGGQISMKVSEKGAVSLYGIGRFPVTLYAEQWGRVLAHGTEIVNFINANADKVSTKADSLIRKAAAAAAAAAPAAQPARTMAFGSLNLNMGRK